MPALTSRHSILILKRRSESFQLWTPPNDTSQRDSGPESPMTHQTHFNFKTYLSIAVMTVAGPLGNVLLGKGMKQIGRFQFWPPSQLIQACLNIVGSGVIWLGIASLITFFVAYMLALSWADYSFVQPASSLAYGVVAFLGYWILGEKVSSLHWAGIAVICLGVFLVGRTNPRTTGHR